MATVLITGGTGLVGRHLLAELVPRGHRVRILSRCCHPPLPHITCYPWNPEQRKVSDQALVGVDVLIHLAGANIGEKRWTSRRKREILSSRVQTLELLEERFSAMHQWPRTVLSASAVGYYGLQPSEKPFTENDPPGNDFLAGVCVRWENAALRFQQKGIRTAIFRMGVVLAPDGGALQRLLFPAKIGLLSPLGSGKQAFPWIHIDDLVTLFRTAVEDDRWSGIYNAVAPHCPTNQELVHALAKILGKPVRLPNVPAWILQFALGEMADLLLKGSCVSAEKLLQSGFRFRYPFLDDALKDLLIRETA